MTEQNRSANAQSEGQDARVEWPAYAGEPAAGDPAVDALLVRLEALPELPISAHGEVYASLHDELVAALNEDVAGQAMPNQAVPNQAVPGQSVHGQAAGKPRP